MSGIFSPNPQPSLATSGQHGLLSSAFYALLEALSSVVVATNRGMVADLAEGTASITTATTALTVAGIALTAAHVGKTVVVRGAGGTDKPLLTTITAVGSSTTATVANAASATVTGALCSIGTNNATALQTALTAAAGGTLLIPPGDYLVAANVGTVASDGAIATVPSNTSVLGFPRKSRLHHLGSDNNNSGYWNNLLRVANGSTAVRFAGLHFTSDNKSSFTYVLNCQASAIDIQLTDTRDVWTVGCTFDDLWGFSVHDRGNNQRVHACFNVMRNCANGLNVNADYSLQIGNWFEGGEGIEASGVGSVIALNVVKDGQGVGISAGGDLTAGVLKPQVVVGNYIDGVVGGLGVITAQSTAGTVIAGNVIRRCDFGGLQIQGGSGGAVGQWVLVFANAIYGNCVDPGGNVVGLFLTSGNTGPHFVIGNAIFDGGLTGFNQKYAINSSATDSFFAANYLSSTFHDLSLNGTGCRVVGNMFATNSAEYAVAPAVTYERVVITGGATGARPATPTLYEQYFDTTLHQLITWDGGAWRDGSGASV